jgi:phosphoserine phosphatase RsbU/P
MFGKIKKSISARLSTYVIFITAIIFIIAVVIVYSLSRRIIKQEAIRNAESLLDYTNLSIDNVLRSVALVVDNLTWNVNENINDPEQMYEITRKVLSNNEMIVGCAIAFAPDYYKSQGYYFAPYSYRDEGQIISMQLGRPDYNYFMMDWYLIPSLLNKPMWSEPYFDEGGAEVAMTTYSKPIYDRDGKFCAIFTSDISLKWLTDIMSRIKPYEHSYTFALGRGAKYIVHPDQSKVYNETIFTVAMVSDNKAIKRIGDDMIAGKNGMETVILDGVLNFVFYAPVKTTGWSVAIVCPVKDVFASLSITTYWLIAIMVVGLVLLFLVCFFVIGRVTRPLKLFANSARQIATGDFKAQLPMIKTKDEMAEMCSSFEFMKESLADYMEKLKSTTSVKERIESELRIASEIQMGMIPKIFPPFPDRDDIDLFATLKPAKEVGGDLYDFFIDNEKLYFVIGDVSGKGVPASLLMAVTRSLFRSVAVHMKTAEKIANSINKAIAETNESNMFVTLFIGILDLNGGMLDYCNAGHNPPLLSNGKNPFEFIKMIPNMPAGLFESFEYKGQQMIIEKGTTLFMYTDGLTEAENAAKELYGDDRLQRIVNEGNYLVAYQLTDAVVEDVRQFVNGSEQSDDLTVLTIKYSNIMEKSIKIDNKIDEISRLSQFTEQVCSELRLDPELTMKIVLALEEAVSNVILYAYPKEENAAIDISFRILNGNLIISITDQGKEFDPTKGGEVDISLSADERPIGGLGIFLIKQIMNEVEYKRIAGSNVLTMKKNIK